MIRLIIVLFVVIGILILLRSRSKNSKITNNNYKKVIISIIVIGLLILIATSGRYLLPQVLQFIKIGLPFITRMIGI
jgi:hypothetical protein